MNDAAGDLAVDPGRDTSLVACTASRQIDEREWLHRSPTQRLAENVQQRAPAVPCEVLMFELVWDMPPGRERRVGFEGPVRGIKPFIDGAPHLPHEILAGDLHRPEKVSQASLEFRFEH